MSKPRLLLVEDSRTMALHTARVLSAHGFDITVAEDGQAGWEMLIGGDAAFDAILLDREMPRMNGMELLRRVKALPRLSQIPAIMVTSVGDSDSIREGLAEGAYYYVTKPFEPDMLVSIVNAAVGQYGEYRALQETVRQAERPFEIMESGTFRFRSIEDGRKLANSLARACPHPEKAVFGLQELMVNAVEHGNLAISYQDKTRLLVAGTWQEEVHRRLASPECGARQVTVHFERGSEAVTITVSDQGDGFEWQRYVDFDTERAFDNHGRGIAMAKALSFDSLQYVGKGNTVVATIKSAPS